MKRLSIAIQQGMNAATLLLPHCITKYNKHCIAKYNKFGMLCQKLRVRAFQEGNTQARYTFCNSSLSELQVMGFEVGFSISNSHSLFCWEAVWRLQQLLNAKATMSSKHYKTRISFLWSVVYQTDERLVRFRDIAVMDYYTGIE